MAAHTDVTCECQRFDCSGETLGQRLGGMARPERSENLPQASREIEAGIGNCPAKRFHILLRLFTRTFFGTVFFSESECRTCGARADVSISLRKCLRLQLVYHRLHFVSARVVKDTTNAVSTCDPAQRLKTMSSTVSTCSNSGESLVAIKNASLEFEEE